VEQFVTTIAGSKQTRDEHLPLILDCLREMAPVSDVDRLVQRRLVDLATASLTAAATADWDAPSRLRLWLVLAELDRLARWTRPPPVPTGPCGGGWSRSSPDRDPRLPDP
jgi:hypothetical protein